MAWMRTRIKINEELKPLARIAVAQEVIDRIIKRTQDQNIDKNGKRFPGYSKSYKQSLDFKLGGKSPGDVDLTLSGEMLNSIKLLSHKRGSILIGFERGSNVNDKAEGNIRGTYGSKRADSSKARDFLGLPEGDVKEIEERFIPNRANREIVAARLAAIKRILDGDSDEQD